MYVKFADLPVKDQSRAVAFYTDNLGMSVAQDESYGGDWRWIELEMSGGETKLLMSKSSAVETPESPTLILVVDDISAVYDQLVDADVEIKQQPEASQ